MSKIRDPEFKLATVCDRLGRQNDPSLTILNLKQEGMGNEGAVLLAQALRQNTHLVVLFLDHNEIQGRGASALAEAAAHHPRLAHVFLSNNSLGDTGARAWAQALSINRRLECLKLARNGVGPAGAQALAQALAANTTLQELVLAHNAVGDEGARALAQALVHNNSLLHLDLRYNGLQDRARVEGAFLDVLRTRNKILHSLPMQEEEEDVVMAASSSPEVSAAVGDLGRRYSQEELDFHLHLNRLGRHSWGETETLSGSLWCRVLAQAGRNIRPELSIMSSRLLTSSSCSSSSSAARVYAVLSHRPDLLLGGRREPSAPSGSQKPGRLLPGTIERR